MQLHEIKVSKKHGAKKSQRVGRGGRRGKTSGRGMKGQKARAGHRLRPEIRDFIKKIPKLRGHGQNRARTVNDSRRPAIAINLGALEAQFNKGDTVNIDTLLEKGIVSTKSGKKPKVKILAKGEVTKVLVIENLPISEAAKEAVKKAGGSVK